MDSIIYLVIAAIFVGVWWYLRTHPYLMGGGRPSTKTPGSMVFTWNQQEKPTMRDVKTKVAYTQEGYQIITHKPLKLLVRLKEKLDYSSAVPPAIKEVYFTEGVNEPYPAHRLASCFYPKPGEWWFSEVGNIPEDLPLEAQDYIETVEQEKENLASKLSRVEEEGKAEVKRTVRMVGRYLKPAPPRRGGSQDADY